METVEYRSSFLAQKIERHLIKRVERWSKEKKKKPVLLALASGDDKASEIFVRKKKEKGEEIGVEVRTLDIRKWSVKKVTGFLGRLDEQVEGVFCQLPMGERFFKKQEEILNSIPSGKDVDCLGKAAIGHFERGEEKIMPAMIKAVSWVLGDIGIKDFKKQKVGVVGDRGYMGKMMIRGLKNWGVKDILGVNRDNFKELTDKREDLDLIISCAGTLGLIKGEMIREGVIMIDVGTSLVKGRIRGDVDFSSVKGKAGLVTMVPGGVGPLTVLALFDNLLNVII